MRMETLGNLMWRYIPSLVSRQPPRRPATPPANPNCADVHVNMCVALMVPLSMTRLRSGHTSSTAYVPSPNLSPLSLITVVAKLDIGNEKDGSARITEIHIGDSIKPRRTRDDSSLDARWPHASRVPDDSGPQTTAPDYIP